METKDNPNPGGCLAKALPDEPMFILLGRDPSAPDAIRRWCELRALDSVSGEKRQDAEQLDEAFLTAEAMEAWRESNAGRWHQEPPRPGITDVIARALFRYNDFGFDYDSPETPMQQLQKQICVDSAACVAADLAYRPELAGAFIKPQKTETFSESRGDAIPMAGTMVVTAHGTVEVVDAPGFTTAIVNRHDPADSRIAVICYSPEPGTIGVGMAAQLDSKSAKTVAASLNRLADYLSDGSGIPAGEASNG